MATRNLIGIMILIVNDSLHDHSSVQLLCIVYVVLLILKFTMGLLSFFFLVNPSYL